MKKIITILAVIFLSQVNYSQSVGIGTNSPNGSALLDLQSTSKGFLLPRMNSTQRNMIPSPASGLLIYDTDKGAVYMYDGDQWLPLGVSNNTLSIQPRTSNTPTANTGFGWRSCISGNYAVISTCKATGMGAGPWIDTVFVFEKQNGGWKYMSKLLPASPVGGEGFGQALAIAGDYLLVGAPNKNNNSGAVYAFTRSGQNWIQTAILTPASPMAGSKFGQTISIGGSYALIGAPGYFANGIARGTVYSFSRNISTWTQVQQLWGISSLESFGESIDVSGAYALIGAPSANFNGINNSGIAYFFKRESGSLWTPVDTIYNANAQVNDEFGFSVAVNESTNWAFISRPNRTGWLSNTGEVCTYNILPGGLTLSGLLSNPSPFNTTFSEFGYSLSVYNDFLLISVPQAYNDDAAKGRVYVYKYDGTQPDMTKRWKPWKMLKDESLISEIWYYDTYGFSVYINGFDIVMGNPGANNFTGKVMFLNVF